MKEKFTMLVAEDSETDLALLEHAVSTLGERVDLQIARDGDEVVSYLLGDGEFAALKSLYRTNPTVEAVDIARYIKKNSSPEDKIAILGSEPEILFYSDRLSATGYIYTYNMVEDHAYNLKMQEEMISEIENAKPSYIVFVNVSFS